MSFEKPRLNKRFPLFAIADLKHGDRTFTAMVDNFSLTGMGLYCLHPVRVDTPLEAEVKFVTREGLEGSERIKGRVVWTIRHREIYMLGVAFERPLSEDEHPRLYRLYHSLLEVY